MTTASNLMQDLGTALPEIFLALAALLLLMVGVFRKDEDLRGIYTLSVLALVMAGLFMTFDLGRPLGLSAPPSTAHAITITAFNGLFVVDGFTKFMKGLVLLGAALTLTLTWRYSEREGMNRFELPVLLLFATLGMLMTISANDLISLYVAFELMSLSLYVTAAFRRDSLRASEAGLKYFVLGALSSGMLLYGLSMTYGFAGTTSFDGLALQLSAEASGAGEPSLGLIVGLVFISAGLAFKVSAVPFHMWTPDVYEGSPTAVTAFFAAAPKIAAIALLTRVMMVPFGALADEWQQIVIAISLGSMLLGAFGAIAQSNIKRLMAYSSIGHVGYALTGLAAASEPGVRGLVLYMAIYLFMTVGSFAVILSMRVNGRTLEGVEDFKGLSRTHPLLALAFAILMFSMVGLPPLAGFFAKFYVFMAVIEAGLVPLAVIGVLSSVVGGYYYLRLVKLMYFDEAVESFDRPIGREVGLILLGTTLVVLFFFAAPNVLIDGAAAAARALVPGG